MDPFEVGGSAEIRVLTHVLHRGGLSLDWSRLSSGDRHLRRDLTMAGNRKWKTGGQIDSSLTGLLLIAARAPSIILALALALALALVEANHPSHRRQRKGKGLMGSETSGGPCVNPVTP